MSTEIGFYEQPPQALERPHPREIIQQATEEANVLAEVIDGQKLYSVIQGKKFVKVEGWVTLATLRGCLPREVSVVEKEEGRYVAEVELVRMNDGAVLTKASAECGGPEEPTWQGRSPNARRSMAITRATGKACRIGFSWVMALSGFEVTPAEEMEFAQPPTRLEPAPSAYKNSDASYPQPKGEVREFLDDANRAVWRGTLLDSRDYEGTNKAGKPYKRWFFKGQDGKEFNTFSATAALGLLALVRSEVEITWKPGMKKDEYDILACKPASGVAS